jgi:hypothetical protein
VVTNAPVFVEAFASRRAVTPVTDVLPGPPFIIIAGAGAPVAAIFPSVPHIFTVVAHILAAVADVLPPVARAAVMLRIPDVFAAVADILAPIMDIFQIVPDVLAAVAAVFEPVMDILVPVLHAVVEAFVDPLLRFRRGVFQPLVQPVMLAVNALM